MSLQKGKNVKIRNTLLEGGITVFDGITLRDCVVKGSVIVGSSLDRVRVIGDVKIGKYCSIATEVTFQGLYHVMYKPAIQMQFYKRITGEDLSPVSKGPILIGNDVWIGHRSIILSGVTIGDGAVIGAGSVVTHDVLPYEIVAGNSATHIGWRFPKKTRGRLLALRWWDWPEERIKENYQFFETNLKESDGFDKIR